MKISKARLIGNLFFYSPPFHFLPSSLFTLHFFTKFNMNRILEEIKVVQDELNLLRENHKNDLKEKLDAIKNSENELRKLEAEIEKQQKDLVLKRSKDLVQLRNQLHEKTFDLLQTNEAFAMASFLFGAFSVTEERLGVELAHITQNTNDTRAALKKTELELLAYRDEGARLQEELRAFIKAQV